MPIALVASLTSCCVFLGGTVGLLLHKVVPVHHPTKDTRDVVQLGTGMLSVLAALVLGLLIATARDTLASADQAIRSFLANLIQSDQTLRAYGEEAMPAVDLLHRYTSVAARQDWLRNDSNVLDGQAAPGSTLKRFQ